MFLRHTDGNGMLAFFTIRLTFRLPRLQRQNELYRLGLLLNSHLSVHVKDVDSTKQDAESRHRKDERCRKH